MVIKKSQTTSKSLAKTAKSSAKKNISSSKTKIAKKTEIKKPEKAVKASGTKLPGPKTAAKPAATKSLSEIKKLIKPIEVKKTGKVTSAAKKPDKTSVTTTKVKKASPKESLKTISVSKSETLGKPLKKSPVKIVNIKTRITQKKTIKPASTKKPSAQKVSKVIGKTEGKTAEEIKVPAKTVSAAKTQKKTTVKTVKIAGSKVTPNKTIKPVSAKKPSAQKVSKVIARNAEVKTAKKIKVTAKTVSAAKTKKKTTAKKTEAKVTLQKTIKPAGTKKPTVQKVSNVIARETEGKTTEEIKAPVKAVSAAIKEKKRTVKTVKTSIQKSAISSSTIPRIKETLKQKTVLKPKENIESALSTSRKTVKKKVTPSLITPEPLPGIIEEKVHPQATMTQAETKPKKASKLKVFLPEEELQPEEALQAHLPQLPEEYGENELIVMEVDPSIVFVSWEVKPDDISGEAGKLSLRVYDVTGIDFDGTNASRFFDISLRSRADSKFFDIKMQGRDIIMEIGLLHPDGTFKAIKQSSRVSMPALQSFDELDIAGSLSESKTLIGY